MELHPSIQERNAVDGSSARLRAALTLLPSGRKRPKSWGMETRGRRRIGFPCLPRCPYRTDIRSWILRVRQVRVEKKVYLESVPDQCRQTDHNYRY